MSGSFGGRKHIGSYPHSCGWQAVKLLLFVLIAAPVEMASRKSQFHSAVGGNHSLLLCSDADRHGGLRRWQHSSVSLGSGRPPCVFSGHLGRNLLTRGCVALTDVSQCSSGAPQSLHACV